jgi:DNA topoisomerase-1
MLKKFYWPFHELVEETIENAERPSRERILGKDPETGRTLLTRMSRRGPVIQIGAPDELEEDEKPKYANLQPGQSMETITYEEALKLFQLPKDLGEFQDKPVSVGVGRYGPYVRHDDKYVSIPRGEDPLELSLERAKELIIEKQKADAPFTTYKGEPVFRGKGRFGPFLKYKGLYVNIPRRYNPEELTLEQAFELIEAKLEKEANRYIHQWEEEKISVENGRWGPFIRFGKKNIKIPKVDGERVTSEQAAEFTLEQVKEIITAEIPDAFKEKKKKKTATKKKATAKKTTAKKK